MSSSPVPSALDARTQAFPLLTADQISRVRPGSKIRDVKQDEILFEPGDKNVPFFVLLSGKLDILQPVPAGERLIVTHGPGSFTVGPILREYYQCVGVGDDGAVLSKVVDITRRIG